MKDNLSTPPDPKPENVDAKILSPVLPNYEIKKDSTAATNPQTGQVAEPETPRQDELQLHPQQPLATPTGSKSLLWLLVGLIVLVVAGALAWMMMSY